MGHSKYHLKKRFFFFQEANIVLFVQWQLNLFLESIFQIILINRIRNTKNYH